MIAYTEEEYTALTEAIRKIGGGEFNELDEETIRFWLDFVQPMVSRKQYGNLYKQAVVLLVCHKLKLAGYGENTLGDLGKIGNAFAASSVSDGGSSISFATSGVGNTQADAEYGMTVYGAQYLQLRRMAVIPIRVSGEEVAYGGL